MSFPDLSPTGSSSHNGHGFSHAGKAQPREYWLDWTTHGKEGTLMPGFATELGGPLSQEQIESLVDALFELNR